MRLKQASHDSCEVHAIYALGLDIQVECNGSVVDHVIRADAEAGVVEYYPYRDGAPMVSGESFVVDRKRGDVVIRVIGGSRG